MNRAVKNSLIIGIVLVILVETTLLVRTFLKINETIDTNNNLEEKLENSSKENNAITTDYLLTIINDNKLNIFDQFNINIDFSEDEIQKKLTYAYLSLIPNYNLYERIRKEDIENALFKVFGDTEIKHQNIECFCKKDLILYDPKLGIYSYNDKHLGHGGVNFAYGSDYNKPLSLTISNDQYKLIVSKIFIGLENKIYSSVDMNENHYLFDVNENSTKYEIIKKYEQDFQYYKDKIVKYSYTFKKKNGKFNLIKYEILD